jgi:hypothetical protein
MILDPAAQRWTQAGAQAEFSNCLLQSKRLSKLSVLLGLVKFSYFGLIHYESNDLFVRVMLCWLK